VLFHEAMEKFNPYEDLKDQFPLFERAAAKGHEESIWILSVVKDVEMEDRDALIEAFAKTGEPLGWCFAARLSFEREQFDLYKKSAEGECSWGQVEYGIYFNRGGAFAEKDEKAYVEWLEKAASQNNPWAMFLLGLWFELYEGGDKQKAVSYYHSSTELGWKRAMRHLAGMFRDGEGCEKDLRQALIWGAKGDSYVFGDVLDDARRALELETTEKLDCDFNQLCYLLGWGLYWYECETRIGNRGSEKKLFGPRCLDFYCATMELQRESIFTFLLFWNRTVGVKDVGTLIGKMVWEEDRNVWVKRLWKN
jgi:hypothetical protein